MNLLCPTCQKQLQVPEQYAGQMMKCPLCDNPFTVPVLPQMPQAVQSPAPAAPTPPAARATTQRPAAQPAPAAASLNAAPLAGGLTINPRVIPWLAPVSLLAIFVLTFFPWVGMYPGGVGVVTQTGWQAAFGSATVDTDWHNYVTREKYWKEYYGPDVEPLGKPSLSFPLIVFVLLLIPATLVALLAEALAHRLIPINLSSDMTPYLNMRPMFVGALALVMLIMLVLVSGLGFPLEAAAEKQVENTVNATREAAPTAEKKDEPRWAIEYGIRLGGFNLRTRAWFTFAVILNTIAVAGAVMHFLMERRAAAAPSNQ